MIEFTKMQGLGNDYIYIDCIKKEKPEKLEKLSMEMSDRHYGIGSDGLIIIEKSNVADYKMEMYNRDGSRGTMCGNGIRCMAKYLWDNKYINSNYVNIETDSGIRNVMLNIKDEKITSVTVDMGSAKIIKQENFFTKISIGNMHLVTEVEDLTNIPDEINKNANIEYVKINSDKEIELRVIERGSGETLSCGTGACAAFVYAAFVKEKTSKSNVNVIMPGGELSISIDKKNGHIYMTGEAKTIYKGIYIKN